MCECVCACECRLDPLYQYICVCRCVCMCVCGRPLGRFIMRKSHTYTHTSPITAEGEGAVNGGARARQVCRARPCQGHRRHRWSGQSISYHKDNHIYTHRHRNGHTHTHTHTQTYIFMYISYIHVHSRPLCLVAACGVSPALSPPLRGSCMRRTWSCSGCSRSRRTNSRARLPLPACPASTRCVCV